MKNKIHEEVLREVIRQVEAFIDNHKGRLLDLIDMSELLSILKPIYEEKKRKQVEELKKKIKRYCKFCERKMTFILETIKNSLKVKVGEKEEKIEHYVCKKCRMPYLENEKVRKIQIGDYLIKSVDAPGLCLCSIGIKNEEYQVSKMWK